MTLTRRNFNQTMLRGLGVAVALPFLESQAWAADPPKKAGKPPVRMAFVSVPNGVNMAHWALPNATTLSPTLTPLKDILADVLIISNCGQDKAKANGDGAGDHARETGTLLTGVQLRKTNGTDIKAGISVDQVAAARIGHLTPLPSLELGIDGAAQAGNCDSGYSCAYTSNISWRTPSTPMLKETSPKAVFRRLFVDVRQGAGAQAAASEIMLRRSVLDLVMNDAKRLSADLGGSDKGKLDEYLDSVRSLEQRVDKFVVGGGEEPTKNKLPAIEVPDGKPEDVDPHIKLMFDLLALGWQADVTRVATFMIGNGGNNRVYSNLGISGGHHELSHHGGNAEKIESIRTIDKYHVEMFTYFVKKLKSIKEPNGTTLLDNCMVLYASGTGDGDRHNHSDLPVLLAGRAGGSIKPGKPIVSKGNMCDLFLAMLARVGATTDSIGDSGKMMELPNG
ncbi:MAG: DUF1552 domain-containing protein [Planctomycetes bacterium]|nr:DUF1552 domain-containing protein [Planctomycetota bacterium]